MNQLSHVLILGCGRSGTSIFGELFEELPTYQYYSEPDFDKIFTMDFSNPVAIKVPRESKMDPPDPGLSISVSRIYDVIPGPLKIYWMVRHPLDTICSLKVGIAQNWGHHPRPLDWKDWLEKPLLLKCAHHWNYLNSVGYAQICEYAVIKKFEDLIREPFKFAQNITEEINHTQVQKKHVQKWASRIQDGFNGKYVEAITSRPYSTRDHSVKVGRYKENMSPKEIELISLIVRSTAKALDYIV